MCCPAFLGQNACDSQVLGKKVEFDSCLQRFRSLHPDADLHNGAVWVPGRETEERRA